jgi:hypothetical protein
VRLSDLASGEQVVALSGDARFLARFAVVGDGHAQLRLLENPALSQKPANRNSPATQLSGLDPGDLKPPARAMEKIPLACYTGLCGEQQLLPEQTARSGRAPDELRARRQWHWLSASSGSPRLQSLAKPNEPKAPPFINSLSSRRRLFSRQEPMRSG